MLHSFRIGLSLICLLSLSGCGPLIGVYLLQGPETRSLFAADPLMAPDIEEEAPSNEASSAETSKAGRKAP